MSHEIETMAYAGEVPWHGLGEAVTNDMSPSDMMKAAGLDWTVSMTANHYPPDHATHPGEVVPNSHFIERESDGSILGEYVAGTMYKPFQNADLFEFFAPFIDDKSMFLHTAGSLFGGKKVWCMATTNEGFTLGKDDQVNNNLLFTIAHTGVNANSALLTPIRVVCNNTMRLALQRADDIVTHNHRVPFDAEAMKVALGISSETFGKFEEVAKAMAKKVLKGDEELEFFKYVFGGKEREGENGVVIHSEGVRKAMAAFRGQQFSATTTKARTQTKAQLAEVAATQAATLDDLIASIKAGKDIDIKTLESKREDVEPVEQEATQVDGPVNPGHDLKSAEGTLWGAYQTVMWMADHNPVRNYGPDLRLDRALYGATSGRDIKSKAHERALELVA